eukprot:1144680-Pelagomonas_calceolata.AAC.1
MAWFPIISCSAMFLLSAISGAASGSVFNNLGLPGRFSFNSVSSRVMKGSHFFNLLEEREVWVQVIKPKDGFAKGCVLLVLFHNGISTVSCRLVTDRGFQRGLDRYFNDAEPFPQGTPECRLLLMGLGFSFWRKVVASAWDGFKSWRNSSSSWITPCARSCRDGVKAVRSESLTGQFRTFCEHCLGATGVDHTEMCILRTLVGMRYHKGDMVAEEAQEDNAIYAAERVYGAVVNVLAGCLAVSPWSGISLYAWGEVAREEEVAVLQHLLLQLSCPCRQIKPCNPILSYPILGQESPGYRWWCLLFCQKVTTI